MVLNAAALTGVIIGAFLAYWNPGTAALYTGISLFQLLITAWLLPAYYPARFNYPVPDELLKNEEEFHPVPINKIGKVFS
jgi:hypothetical protein